MIEIIDKYFKWVNKPLEENTIIQTPQTTDKTKYSSEDCVDAWRFFMTCLDKCRYSYGWDLSDTDDYLSVTVYEPENGETITIKKWNTWDKDIKVTYGIYFLYPSEEREFFNNKKAWEERISELESDFPWEPAVPLMVYTGKTLIATVDYDLNKEEND